MDIHELDPQLRALARTRHSLSPHADYDDLLQEARLAVLERPDEKNRRHMLSHVWWTLAKFAGDQQRPVRVPSHYVQSVRRAQKALGRAPEPHEVSDLPPGTARAALDAMASAAELPQDLHRDEPEPSPQGPAELALALLPARLARAFELHAAGFSNREVGEELGVSKMQAGRMVEEARQELQEVLAAP